MSADIQMTSHFHDLTASRTVSADVSTFRLYLLRTLYLLNFAGLGLAVWPELINHRTLWDPLAGVAFSFWATLALLCGLGLRYPLQMLPVLLMQLFYKSIWLVAVMLPRWSAGRSTAMTKDFVMGLIADLIVIPWPYVFSKYVKNHGDRWK
jgi:hypothetical protein